MNESITVLSSSWKEYELIDSGNRKKLERFGPMVLVRTEPKAWWEPALPTSEWSKAHAVHDDTKWIFHRKTNREWIMAFQSLAFQARLTDGSKHVGIFPEQSPHWEWITAKAKGKKHPSLLNLFGYTGAASLVAAKAGCVVTHVDASKPAITWGKANQELSGMQDVLIRWLLDDALKFSAREIRRGKTYDAIILDPPSFGRGPKNEVWKAERQLTELLSVCRQLLSPSPVFLILTMYNLEASSLMLGNILEDTMSGLKGRVHVGELALPHASSSKMLPLSIFGRWEQT